ncbi:hypothetical protein HAHE_29340 [Haloferula helveola]|uniref:Sulfatase N-terminal domain-containing protein n=1 Tax=Haloferula helveola TaxID=490095 RepID=A0ABM7RFL2_9BACT|nr:hypothetical protein HAHE_29340 [Haloferula helveola]
MSSIRLSFPAALLALAGVGQVHADVTLSTLTDSQLVGQNDTDPLTAPAVPGDGWFTGPYSGTVRQRESGSNEQWRTQWYLRFDISALSGVDPGLITGATFNILQIGRLNTVTTGNSLKVFDVNSDWDDDGGNYPTWNLGREAPTGAGGTELENFGTNSYQQFGTTTDTSNPDVEGTFVVTGSALLDTVKSWASDPADNEGLLVTMINVGFAGLAFGPPTLEITVLVDTDGDGMPDQWEDDNGLDKTSGLDADLDNDAVGGPDGLTNLEEYQVGTDPQDSDSDDDTLSDGDEVNGTLNPWSGGVLGTPPGDPTNPLEADSDGDGTNDADEIAGGTDPNAFQLFPFVDTDGDGYRDDAETAFGSDPNDAGSRPDHASSPAQPNVVIIYADDMGFGDVSRYANLYGTTPPAPTPRMDSIGEQGVTFLEGHSSNGICTPSRYALLTGQYNWRLFNGITGYYCYGGAGKEEVPLLSDVTLAEYMKGRGYDTAAFGKWHLGGEWYAPGGSRITTNPTDPTTIDWSRLIVNHATDHGFDRFHGMCVTNNFGPYLYVEDNRNTIWHPGANSGAGGYVPIVPDTAEFASAIAANQAATQAQVTDGSAANGEVRWFSTGDLNTGVQSPGIDSRASLGDDHYSAFDTGPRMIEAFEEYIADRAGASDPDPFFCYVPLYYPHKPWVVIPEFQDADYANGYIYGPFMKQVDSMVGRVLDALDANGYGDNTVIILTADNGPENSAMSHSIAYGRDPNGPLRGNKRDVWEGGTRVPFMVRWPGRSAAGLIVEDPVSQVDIFASVAAHFGDELADGVATDGESFLNLLHGQAKPGPSRPGVIMAAGRGDLGIVTPGGWKFIDGSGGGDNNSWDSSDQTIPSAAGTNQGTPKQLFRLDVDLGEDNNLISGVTSDSTIRSELTSQTGTDLLGVIDALRVSGTATLYERRPDNDADGMPNEFETANGLNLDDPSDASEDKDGDGQSNLDEFVSGTDPCDAASAFRVLDLNNTEGLFSVMWQGHAGRDYTASWSIDGETWTDAGTQAGVDGPMQADLDKAAIDALDGVPGNLTRLLVRVAADLP